MIDLMLRNTTILDGSSGIDFAVHTGKIIDRCAGLECAASQEIDLQGRLLISGFIESHLHLDIALMNSWEKPGRQESYRSHHGLNEILERRWKNFTQQDLERRAGMALELVSRRDPKRNTNSNTPAHNNWAKGYLIRRGLRGSPTPRNIVGHFPQKMIHRAHRCFQQGSLLSFFCGHARTAWLNMHDVSPPPAKT